MPIPNFQSLCDANQKTIVSRDKGERQEHIAHNEALHIVNQYKVDGVIIKEGKKCDFLLMDETCLNAYLIELKGSDLVRAVKQLEATATALQAHLAKYSIKYRIVANRMNTHAIHQLDFLKFQRKHGAAFAYKTIVMHETF